MMEPACACSNIRRVVLTLSAKRKRVSTKSNVGKTENSSGWRTFMVSMSTRSAKLMLTAKSRSIRPVGSGTTIMTTIKTTARTMVMSP